MNAPSHRPLTPPLTAAVAWIPIQPVCERGSGVVHRGGAAPAISRRGVLGASAAIACGLGSGFAGAASNAGPRSSAAPYPQRAVQLVVPFPPGGSIDMVGRLLADAWAAAWGHEVLIDNRPGASGNVGMQAVAKAAPDGHTLLLAHTGVAANAHIFRRLAFDPMNDLVPIIRLCDQPHVVVVHPSRPYKTLAALIAYAKAQPGRVRVGSSGLGGPQDVAAQLFMKMAGVTFTTVPYKGGAPALADLLVGQLDVMFETAPTAVPNTLSGKLHALAVTGGPRLAALPQVPTPAEAGMPHYRFVGWMGLLAPTGTPPAVLERIQQTTQGLLSQGALRQQLIANHLVPVGGSARDFAAFMRQESEFYAHWAKVLYPSAP